MAFEFKFVKILSIIIISLFKFDKMKIQYEALQPYSGCSSCTQVH